MKKAQGLSLDTIIIAAVILLILIVMWALFTGKFDTFNPERDVCTNANYGGEGHFEGDWWCYDTGFTECVQSPDFRCLKWRPKNKCELDSNAEGCVCEETHDILVGYTPMSKHDVYLNKTDFIIKTDGGQKCEETRTQLIKGTDSITLESNSPFVGYMTDAGWSVFRIECEYGAFEPITEKRCLKSHLPPTPIKIDLLKEKCVEWTNEKTDGFDCHIIYHYYEASIGKNDRDDRHNDTAFWEYGLDIHCCIKKEPLTECEKGTVGWIDDGVCRRKILTDYNCKELKKELLVDLCTPKYDEYNSFLDVYPCATKTELYDALEKKGCEI